MTSLGTVSKSPGKPFCQMSKAMTREPVNLLMLFILGKIQGSTVEVVPSVQALQLLRWNNHPCVVLGAGFLTPLLSQLWGVHGRRRVGSPIAEATDNVQDFR